MRHSHEYDLSCFKSLLVTGLWDIILTSLLPPIQSWTSKFWVWSCIANNFDKGWRGNHRDKIMDRPFIPKYGTVSRVLWQLVVELTKFGKIFTDINTMEVNCIDIDRKKKEATRRPCFYRSGNQILKWMWSSLLNKQSKRLKGTLKKFRLDQESNPDLELAQMGASLTELYRVYYNWFSWALYKIETTTYLILPATTLTIPGRIYYEGQRHKWTIRAHNLSYAKLDLSTGQRLFLTADGCNAVDQCFLWFKF